MKTKTAAMKPKARVFEIKAESREATAEDDHQRHSKRQANPNWQERDGREDTRGSGHYGPMDTPEIQQRKANTRCGYCGNLGQWWQKCRARLKDLNGQQPAQQQLQPAQATASSSERRGASAATTPADPAATSAVAPENGQRQ
ncbi:hypothetical protein GN244_ATG07706 [Phytophthora infestans]|uniref:CCHC-type domain-containing protein n=1 Tax=Phytophthora infestans TaxID=4787 RepID=A0A833SEJ4_PHYIN|nr:hypothetical protein GN244_ATG07706 [Phytophthora infestans]